MKGIGIGSNVTIELNYWCPINYIECPLTLVYTKEIFDLAESIFLGTDNLLSAITATQQSIAKTFYNPLGTSPLHRT